MVPSRRMIGSCAAALALIILPSRARSMNLAGSVGRPPLRAADGASCRRVSAPQRRRSGHSIQRAFMQDGAEMSRRAMLGSAAGLVAATVPREAQGAGEVKVFIACSLDGFIAGPNGELDWLPGPDAGVEDTFAPFMKTVGAMLMGRTSFDVVNAMGPAMWAYGDTPFFVATSRALTPPRPSVRAITGDITSNVAAARSAADGKVVYLDGGALIRSALDAGLVDEIIVTLVPKLLGKGVPLFAGVSRMQDLEMKSSRSIGGGLLQITYRPRTQ